MQKLAATGPDIFGYLLKDTADSTIRSVITFKERLPLSSLKESIDSVLSHRWVLASRLESDGKRWMNWIHEPDISSIHCISEDWMEELDPEPLLFQPLDDGTAPQLHLNLLHGPDNDILVISTPHSVLDGKGIKDLTSMVLLGCTGQFFDENHHGFSPRSELPIWGTIDEDSFKKVSEDKEWPGCSWPSLYLKPQHTNGRLLRRRVRIKDLNAVRRSLPGKVTIHDMLMASFYLALVEISHGKHCGRVSSTVDDRKYMPTNGEIPDIANISSNYFIAIPENLDGFQKVVDYVSKEHQRKKEDKIGLSNLLAFSEAESMDHIYRLIEEMGKQDVLGMAQYFLSNIGIFDIDEKIMEILGIKDVYFCYPGIKPPTLGITVCTFNDVIELNTGYYLGVDLPRIERFFDIIVNYLVTGKALD